MIDFISAPTHNSTAPRVIYIPASAVCMSCGNIKMFNAAHAFHHSAPVCCSKNMHTFIPRHDDRIPPWPAQRAHDEASHIEHAQRSLREE